MVQYLISENIRISTAESCTGGLVASYIASVPGASNIFELGIVSYSDRIKSEILGVNPLTIIQYGVVSAETALEMAERVRILSGSDVSIGITGLAGPPTADPSENGCLPVGTIYISAIYKDIKITENIALNEFGSFERNTNRLLTSALAFKAVETVLGLI